MLYHCLWSAKRQLEHSPLWGYPRQPLHYSDRHGTRSPSPSARTSMSPLPPLKPREPSTCEYEMRTCGNHAHVVTLGHDAARQHRAEPLCGVPPEAQAGLKKVAQEVSILATCKRFRGASYDRRREHGRIVTGGWPAGVAAWQGRLARDAELRDDGARCRYRVRGLASWCDRSSDASFRGRVNPVGVLWCGPYESRIT
jgi:hypothetical protein